MKEAPPLGLIINSWNQPEYLARVLNAVSAQTSLPDEILLADDGSDSATGDVFKQWTSARSLPGIHVWQEHLGFRRARILNQAIARASSQYLVFLDGDTLPHPQFISDHRRLARPGLFVQGHRALVSEKASRWFGLGSFRADRRRALLSRQIEGIKHAYRWPFPLSRLRSDLRGIRGCNLAVWRDHLIQVNGYNEAFIGWGREDSELAVRLMNLQLLRLDARGWALCFHLWHPPASRASLPANDELLQQARVTLATRCAEGLGQYLQNPIP